MDYIHIRDMQFYGYHGVKYEESVLGQRFRASVSIAVDTKKAGETDNVEDTVSYVDIFNICKDVIEGQRFNLIETIANRIAEKILAQFDNVSGCKVEIIKPDPPIPGNYKEVAVEIVRGKYYE